MGSKQMNPILLDTHVWIWFMNGNKEIKKTIQKKISAAIQQNAIYIAAISLWEMSMLEFKNRITLDMPCLEWINKSIDLINLQILPITPAIAVESCSLPGIFHEDFADRIITATARVEGLTLYTGDVKILEYSRKNHVSALSI
jgi:PIN domain nuclease of toxin-antitoxin system